MTKTKNPPRIFREGSIDFPILMRVILPARTPSGAASTARSFGHAMSDRDRIKRLPLPLFQAR
jgi:hypothetical protein